MKEEVLIGWEWLEVQAIGKYALIVSGKDSVKWVPKMEVKEWRKVIR